MSKVTVKETAGHQWEVFQGDERVGGVMFRKLCDAIAFADGHGWEVTNIFYWQP